MGLRFLPDTDFSFDGISNFTFGITESCNMRCRYCCFSGDYAGMRAHSSARMSEHTINKAIAFVSRHAHPTDGISVSFYGGEALLEFDAICNIITELRTIFGSRLTCDISTNGLLLSEEVIDRLCLLPDTGISVSLDASPEIHDSRRTNPDGSPTYRRIVRNLSRFKEKYPEEYQRRVRLMVTFESIQELELANASYSRFEALAGQKGIHISRVMPNFDKSIYLPDSVESKRRALRDALRKRNLGIRDFHALWLADLERKVTKRFDMNDGCGNIRLHSCLNSLYSIFITSDGTLYPCEKFGTDCSIGNLDSGIDRLKIKKLAIRYTLRRQVMCGTCPLVEFCGRCLADMKLNAADMRLMCNDYKNDIINYLEFHEAGVRL